MDSSRILRIAVRANLNPGPLIDVWDSRVAHFYGKALGLPYTLVVSEDGEFGRQLEDGNWTGLVGMVKNGLADLTFVGYVEANRRVLNFSYPHLISQISFITQKPEETRKTFSFLQTFSIPVWIMTFLTILIMSIVFHVFLGGRFRYQTVLFNMIRSLLLKSWGITATRNVDYLLQMSWFLGAAFLVYCYTAVLFSFLTFPHKIGIKNVLELSKAVAGGTHKCKTDVGVSTPYALLRSEDESMKIIGLHLLKQEANNNIVEVLQEKMCFIGMKARFSFLENQFFISEDNFFSFMVAPAYGNDFCCPRKLNTAVRRVTESGLISKTLTELTFLDNLSSLLNTKGTVDEKSLSLKDLLGPFLVLIVGHSLTCLVFILEIITSYFRHN